MRHVRADHSREAILAGAFLAVWALLILAALR